MSDTPRVWIGCLASYNAGRLIGEWVDATDVDEMTECQERVAKQAVRAAKEAGEYPLYFGDPEEFFIADYDNFPGRVVSALGEYPRYETVAQIAVALDEHGEAFTAYLEACDVDLENISAERFEEVYRGEWDSEESYARMEVDQLGFSNVPAQLYTSRFSDDTINVFDELAGVLDWESIARDMFQHGSYTFHNGHVFEEDA